MKPSLSDNLRKFNRVFSTVLIALLLLAQVGAAAQPAAAQAGNPTPEPPPGRQDDETARREAYLRKFLADQQPVENLTRMPVTPCVGGMAGPYPCSEVDLLAFLPLASIGGGSGNDIWGWTDPLDGSEYALVGRSSGTAFVDISDPVNPIYLGNLPTHSSNSTWRDIKVYSDHAFIVSEASGHGMQVFDLTELRNVVSPPVTFAEAAHYNAFSNAHNIAINEDSGFAYAVGTNTCSGGLHMVNIQNPTAPTNAGCVSSDGYTHDTQCVIYNGPDVLHQGKEICFSSNEDTVTIADVTNKGAPVQLSRTPYSGSGYTHQGWLTDDQVYFLFDDELDEANFGHNTRTRILDVSDLDAPNLIGFFDSPVEAIDHNLYTYQGYAFESNYRAGLRILDLADVANANLSEIAYFDIYPASNSANFNGAWSVYPYFDSGVVVVNGIEQGLFVLMPLLASGFNVNADVQQLQVCSSGADSATLDLTSVRNYTGTVTLSTSGLPAPAFESFSANPVIVPATTVMTVTANGAAAGSYPFTVLGTDGVISATADLTLDIFGAAPGAPGLLAPADGAVDVNEHPTFEWSPASEGVSYELEVASDPGFTTIVYSAVVSGTTYTPSTYLGENTTYYWRTRAQNICGTGSYSAVYSFTVRSVPPVLLVDDDNNAPNVSAYYSSVLDALGIPYDLWDVSLAIPAGTEPAAQNLAFYDAVVWFTGNRPSGGTGPEASGEAALTDFLNNGGCFLISSQDYYFEKGLTTFMKNYLGASSVSNNSGDYSAVTGKGLFEGLGSYALSYPYVDRSDVVTPKASASSLFLGNNNKNAAISMDNGTYLSSYWGFPAEALGAQERKIALARFLSLCGLGQSPVMGLSVAGETPVYLGASATLSATLSAGDNASFAWDFGDGTGASGGAVITHTYAALGDYTVVVTATNAINSLSASALSTVVDSPVQGLAALNDGPNEVGSLTTLDASVADGTNITYTWNFGDGASGSGASVQHTYPAVGEYQAVVTATNGSSQQAVTTTVTIIDIAIQGLAAANDGPTALGEATQLSSSLASGSNVSYTWDFGDGQAGSGVTATHTYTEPGVYEALVTALNSRGQMSATTSITVLDAPVQGLSAAADPASLPVGAATTLSAGLLGGTNVVYTWDFGDGQTGGGASVQHTYTAPGTYTATVTASNSAGSWTATVQIVVTEEEQQMMVIYLPVTFR